MTGDAPIWVLLGHHTGDNNQLLRLAGELGLPFRTIQLRHNVLSELPPIVVGPSLATLTAESRAQIHAPWPDLVLGIGNRSVPIARFIRKASGGRTKVVRLGNPRVDPAGFDLVITTEQYAVPNGRNVVRLPAGISTAPRLDPNPDEAKWLEQLPRPHRLLLIGGNTFMWSLTPSCVAAAAKTLKDRGGSVIAARSPRSSKAVVDAAAEVLRDSPHGLVRGRFPRYPVLLRDADEIHVTADSVAMISDAVATGKPVGLIHPRWSASGALFYSLSKIGLPVPVRDLRGFWTSIQSNGLAGTVERPIAGDLGCDPLATAVAAVRALLKD